MAANDLNPQLPLIVNLNLINQEGQENIDLSKLIIEIDSTLFPNQEQFLKALRNHLLQSFKEVPVINSLNLPKADNNSLKNAEEELEPPANKSRTKKCKNSIQENETSLETTDDSASNNSIKVRQTKLFKSQDFEAIPTAAVMFSSIDSQIKKELWKQNEDGIAYLQHRAKGDSQNFIEHYIANPGDISMLPWDEALQIIDKFGFNSAKLHLIFAAYAMKQERPWESLFILNASDLIKDMGWDQRTDLAKHKKLSEIAKTAFALDCLLVKAVWVEGRNKKGGINASTPVGRMWNITVVPYGQINLQGKIDEPDEVQLIIQPGAWTKHFLNRAGAKSRDALYQFGYLAQQVLKIDPYHDELALRLAIYLTLDSRIRLDGNYKVQELLEIAFAKPIIDRARLDRRRAYDLKKHWDSAIKLLLKLGWQIAFDLETYPEELRPDSKEKKPKGYLDKLLDAKLTIKPPSPIPELIASKAKLTVERLQPKVKPKVEKLQPKATPIPEPQISLTSSQVKEARIAKGWSQSKLAGFLGVSQNLISLIERGERTFNPQLAAQLQTLLDIPD
ncbi:helix-turn-helix transcriptional regulator [Calothrix sp. FACHB-1219]|uniref:helix-turn-helix domain-containing protein n=1 Tax=unclassified Calothrix TaxID=2619626 RepID=UPI001682963E|nr:MULTISPECIES: helix-turn-helix transcriptional regulator [unclassified Calothrix]MBD2207467.1 helix-turn-helix transcriptional regulator [Calothrix sp. FACHB-168]MBD2222019.1 helix-turn-helix transcriptional regulator [Calothrix sp. FACHB-1219]